MSGNFLEPVELVGSSAFCRTVRQIVPVVASSDLPVLILGPTGTGKDVIARMIHRASRRSDKVYLSMNCATLGTLAESELFGHVSGAFTGAIRGTRGFIGSAAGGTLLLDELGELAPPVQAKLLRFLDNGEYFRVGEAAPKHADVRIIAATNQDLEEQCRRKEFREDLYYRLSGMIIKTVPLAQRREDIPELIDHFTNLYAREYGLPPLACTPEAVALLCSREWPGNVRQLRHTIFRLCHFAHNCGLAEITSENLELALVPLNYDNEITKNGPQPPSNFAPRIPKQHSESTELTANHPLRNYKEAKKQALEEFERLYFTRLLQQTQGRIKEALEISNLHRKNFYYKLKKLGIEPKKFRPGKMKSW